MNPRQDNDAEAPQALANELFQVTLHAEGALFEVTDKRTGRTWIQRSATNEVSVRSVRNVPMGWNLELFDRANSLRIAATIRVEDHRPELVVTLNSEGEMAAPIMWPAPFVSSPGDFLILPVNEGISYPADDASIREGGFALYSGHGLCMPWYGVTDGESGWMAIVEMADDAAVKMTRHDGLLGLVPEWHAQMKRFGTSRVIRYVFFDRGGYVAMAKRYREHTRSVGLFKTLDEKRQEIPAVDLLVGAVNVWCWDKDASEICRELRSAGIERILWSNACSPEELAALNAMNVLTSCYDLYQDAMDPAKFPLLATIHSQWTSDAWENDDLMIGKDGNWVRGWEVKSKTGEMIPCGTLCDRQAVSYAERRIPAELATHPYRCRFIDTTTASPWRECYHPAHPMTRSDSKKSKMDLLEYVCNSGLVCGCETGHDAAVPFVHYFEGMLSLAPYRVPDSGRNMAKIWDDVPEDVAKYQTGHKYRIPLWELVYHECVLAQWYWGDYNDKLPALWDRRDLWNALYGTTPMFMFDRALWAAQRERFVKSYKSIAPVARGTGYSEMLSHAWLTDDHSVQRTEFANGVAVTANFGDTAYESLGGGNVPPVDMVVDGIPADKGPSPRGRLTTGLAPRHNIPTFHRSP